MSIKVCLNCKRKIEAKDKRQKYCSRSCSATHSQLGKPSKNRKYASKDAPPPMCECGSKLSTFHPSRKLCKRCISIKAKERAVTAKAKLKKNVSEQKQRKLKRDRDTKYRKLHPKKKVDSYTREERRAYQMKFYYRRKQELINMLGGKCVGCGTDHGLEFDHTKPETKLFALGVGMLSRKWEVVVAEAKKCKLRCRHCHLKRTMKLGHLLRRKQPSGLRPVNAKLTDADVRTLRRSAEAGSSHNSLARDYNVSKIVVFNAIHRKTYKTVV